ncbi:RraA family protein [Prosthecomicrobium pneumaticum]|uniref:Putative 4-hydroxy-4-methyl-2-oxoglutarate aldolase n=1 Tax=Prosthecomicrobium pneumaticum TaxID=81895 RepID=A0A7W9FNR5_9HYPH|nr:RraA family protein [Prosthecomicrobium pneumaticum]MBB5753993.1 regulator of RNase E activity RraA [Prosthecomicrobium pneumaticum]
MTETADRLAACYTGVVHDVMRAMGLKDFTLPAELRPILPEKRIAGPAFTIEGMTDASAAAHDTLLAWTGLLSKAPRGSIWVCQPNDRIVAHMGELSAETLKNKGVRGCIVDGYIRDVDFLLEIGFQAWSRGFTPRDIVSWWLPKATEVPITIGDVEIRSGDYMVADRDGAIRVPAAIVEAVIEKAEVAIGTENLVRKAILEGVDPQEAYLRYGKF